MHELNHKGTYFSVRVVKCRPHTSRAPGHYSDHQETEKRAKTAEVIFTAQNHLESAQDFYQSIKEQAASFGSDPEKSRSCREFFPLSPIPKKKQRQNMKSSKTSSFRLSTEHSAKLSGRRRPFRLPACRCLNWMRMRRMPLKAGSSSFRR